MSMFAEGETVGTLLNVIGLRWDRVRVSAEERSPDLSIPGAGGACTGGASASGVGTGCGGAIVGRGGCGSISPAGVGKGLARSASGALTGRASCLGRTLGRAAGIIGAGNTGGVKAGGVSGTVLSCSSICWVSSLGLKVYHVIEDDILTYS
jgi:hypothetical protein